MKSKRISASVFLITFIMVLQFFTGCAIVPPQIGRPWTRTLAGDTNLPLYSNIYIDVKGSTLALVGDEKLLQDEIRDEVAGLVERRGFKVIDKPGDYNLVFTYKTYRNDKLNSYSASYNNNTVVSYNGYNSNSALGVMIASAVFGLASQSGTTVENSTQTFETYTHIIALEIFKSDSTLIWKGESAWDSDNIDLTGDVTYSLQLLISWLPNDNRTYPRVSAVKESKQDNYYNLKCKGRFFTSPALPYRIAFNYNYILEKDENSQSPSSVENSKAYDAYLDLLQTAEYALPLGEDDYSFPLDQKLWSDVEIGGKYYIGNDKQSSNILIKLKGETQGYKIEKCWIASDEEYHDFESRLFSWQNSLKEYYDLRSN